MSAASDFSAFIVSRLGCDPPPRIEPGRFVRFATSGKRDDDAGYCKLFPDGTGGIAGDFRSGAYHVWQTKRERSESDAERRAWQERIERERREAEALRQREAKDAVERAKAIWAKAQPAPSDHPYLAAKAVKAHGLRLYRGPLAVNGMRCDGAMIVPIRNAAGEIQTLEFISPQGEKRFLPGGRKSGGYYAIGAAADVLYVAEGFATGASVHEASGQAVAVAFDAGNLEPVAGALRQKFPKARIVIAADNDASGTGQAKAEEAARAIGGLIALPESGSGGKDWNDVHRERGPQAVQRALAHARAPAMVEAKGSAPMAPAAFAEDRAPIVALEIGELLQRQFPPMEALLAPWLRKQYLAMVYSQRGVGKTHFGLGVAYAVASGGRFLKWQADKPRKVLYIDGEMPGAAIRDRLAAIIKSSEAEPPEGYFRIITPDVQNRSLPDLADLEGQAEIGELLADAELIVLDNLSTLMRSGVESEGESWLPMASWALARRKEGRAVLFIHHAGKNDTQRGTSRREDLLDVVIKLKHPGDYTPDRGAQFSVIFEKARGLYGDDVREIEATLGQVEGGVQAWTWREAERATQDRVVELVKLGMSDAEIATDLGKDRTTVYRARRKAEQTGQIEPRHGKRTA
jgi:putative DNA primase/helicase